MKKIIEVERLSKSFGKVKAVNDISFYVDEGALFSFLGTNGAGKVDDHFNFIDTPKARPRGLSL